MKRILAFGCMAAAIMLLGMNTAKSASLMGSKTVQLRENAIINEEALTRIEDDDMLKKMEGSGSLVELPNTREVVIDWRLEKKFRWCLPRVSIFLTDLGKEFYKKFHHPLQVNSAVRTVAHQRDLVLINGNAASPSGPRASSHLAGTTIDILKLHWPKVELVWMRKKLLALEDRGLVEATEEFNQAVFHILVLKAYGPKPN